MHQMKRTDRAFNALSGLNEKNLVALPENLLTMDNIKQIANVVQKGI